VPVQVLVALPRPRVLVQSDTDNQY